MTIRAIVLDQSYCMYFTLYDHELHSSIFTILICPADNGPFKTFFPGTFLSLFDRTVEIFQTGRLEEYMGTPRGPGLELN